jgi:hypothetical protein
MPGHWRKISFSFTFRDDNYECEISHKTLRIRIDGNLAREYAIGIKNKSFSVPGGQWIEFEI